MRNWMKSNQTIKLTSADDAAAARELVIRNLIGMGANVIAYDATDTAGQIHYVLKECYPETGCIRQADGRISWKTPEQEYAAKARMRKAYAMQLMLQNRSATENTNAHLIDVLYEANNTLYTITGHSNAITYNKAEDRNLQETLITARSIARAVKAYHDSGYLHLDIKPQNVMILPETRDIVILMDFDSITRMDELAGAPLSYSPNFAAPEQLQGRVSRISPATDVYAIGAVVFNKIFARLPSLEDLSIFSNWDYSGNPLFEALSMKVRRLMTDFLRKTLSTSVKNRYQTMDEVMAALDILITESDPKRRFIIDAQPACSNTFVGRDAELEEIHAKLQGPSPLFITGMKGIGKTELAKNYARLYRNSYDVIRFAEYDGSLKDLISSGELISIENNNSEAITINSFSGLVDERTLLIVDNYRSSNNGVTDEALFDELAGLKCKLLVTSSENANDLYPTGEWIELSKLSQPEQFRLFEKEYGEVLAKDESELLSKILTEIRGYTLLIPLIAKLLKNSSLSFNDVYVKISERGTTELPGKVRHKKDSRIIKGTIGSIVHTVLDLSNLSEDERYVMNCLAVLEGIRIRRAKLIEWIGPRYDDAITDLAHNHWINTDGTGKKALLSIHDVIRDVVRQDKTYIPDIGWIQKPIDEYIKELDNQHSWSVYHPYSYPPFLQIDIFSSNLPIKSWRAIPLPNSIMPKLMNILLHTIDPFREPELIINSLFSIINLNLNRSYLWTPDCDDLLDMIESSEIYNSLSVNNRLYLHTARLFLTLKKMCECDLVAARNDSEIHDLCQKVIQHTERAITIVNKNGTRKTVFNVTYSILYRALFIAGYSLGIHLFTTKYPEYSSTALNEYTVFANHVAQQLQENYPDLIPNDPEKYYDHTFDNLIRYFNRCMTPGSEEQLWEEYCEREKQISMHQEKVEEASAEEFEEYCRYQIVEEYGPNALEWTDKINALLYDMQELIGQCERAGYVEVEVPKEHPEISIELMTEEDMLRKTAECLTLAKEKYEAAVNLADEFDRIYSSQPGLPYYDLRSWHHRWLASACIHACCMGDFTVAKKYYFDYLQTDSLGFGFDFLRFGCPNLNIYNTLKYLGITDICDDILRHNIQCLENDIISGAEKGSRLDNEWLKPSTDRLIQAAETLLKYSELLGDEGLIRKYEAMVDNYKEIKAESEYPGFEFEE